MRVRPLLHQRVRALLKGKKPNGKVFNPNITDELIETFMAHRLELMSALESTEKGLESNKPDADLMFLTGAKSGQFLEDTQHHNVKELLS